MNFIDINPPFDMSKEFVRIKKGSSIANAG